MATLRDFSTATGPELRAARPSPNYLEPVECNYQTYCEHCGRAAYQAELGGGYLCRYRPNGPVVCCRQCDGEYHAARAEAAAIAHITGLMPDAVASLYKAMGDAERRMKDALERAFGSAASIRRYDRDETGWPAYAREAAAEYRRSIGAFHAAMPAAHSEIQS